MADGAMHNVPDAQRRYAARTLRGFSRFPNSANSVLYSPARVRQASSPQVATATKRHPPPTPHESDFYSWALESAEAIRLHRFEGIDWEAVAEELEDMGRSERRALENRFEVLLAHLIKWRFQSDHRSASWTGAIKEQRRKGARLLRQNPGLKSLLPQLIADAYESATALAERDTGIDEANFPASCPWTLEQILDEGYWPEAD